MVYTGAEGSTYFECGAGSGRSENFESGEDAADDKGTEHGEHMAHGISIAHM